MSRLKNLYKYIVEREHRSKGWHDTYKGFCTEVEAIRQRIQNGQRLDKSDEPFLKKLLCDKSNGIASRGQSVLSDKNFQAFILTLSSPWHLFGIYFASMQFDLQKGYF